MRFSHRFAKQVLMKLQRKKNGGKEKLSSVNQMAKNISGLLGKAGVDDKFIAAEIVRIYTDNGYPVRSPIITEDNKLWDCTSIAKRTWNHVDERKAAR